MIVGIGINNNKHIGVYRIVPFSNSLGKGSHIGYLLHYMGVIPPALFAINIGSKGVNFYSLGKLFRTPCSLSDEKPVIVEPEALTREKRHKGISI